MPLAITAAVTTQARRSARLEDSALLHAYYKLSFLNQPETGLDNEFLQHFIAMPLLLSRFLIAVPGSIYTCNTNRLKDHRQLLENSKLKGFWKSLDHAGAA